MVAEKNLLLWLMKRFCRMGVDGIVDCRAKLLRVVVSRVRRKAVDVKDIYVYVGGGGGGLNKCAAGGVRMGV